jgi:hypothetical protein
VKKYFRTFLWLVILTNQQREKSLAIEVQLCTSRFREETTSFGDDETAKTSFGDDPQN